MDVHADFSAGGKRPAPPEANEDREEAERRLIAKLHEAGQLKASYLLRALREGRLSLFEVALAKLGGFTSEQVRVAICANQPELLALACAAVEVDRSVFPTLLKLVRGLNGGLPSGQAESAERAFGAFGSHPDSTAATAFRHAVAAV